MPFECPYCPQTLQNRFKQAHLNAHENKKSKKDFEEFTATLNVNVNQQSNNSETTLKNYDNQNICDNNLDSNIKASSEFNILDADIELPDAGDDYDDNDLNLNTFVLPDFNQGSEIIDDRNKSIHELFNRFAINDNATDELIKWINNDSLAPGNIAFL